jgi:hypothetical protein
MDRLWSIDDFASRNERAIRRARYMTLEIIGPLSDGRIVILPEVPG